MKSSKPPTTRRPPHPSLSGQSRSSQLLFESPLEAWREETTSGHGGIFSADRIAALAVVMMIIFSQVSFAGVPAAQAATDTYRDEVSSIAFDGSDGTIGWSATPWVEAGESDGAGDGTANGGGQLAVLADSVCGVGNNCIQLRADSASVFTLSREVDLSAATASTLTFDYFRRYISGTNGAVVVLEISDDGGSGWNPLVTFTILATDGGFNPHSVDLSSYSSANALLRFRTDGSNRESALYVDDFQVEITTPSNGSPVAIDDSATIPYETATVIDVLANDTDPDGDTLIVNGIGTASNGSTATNVTHVTYTPNAGYIGPDSFTYLISDGNGGFDTGAVTVTVSSGPTVAVVNSTGDSSDNNAGDHMCDTGGTVGSDPECTLRAAIEEANASATVDTIEFNIPVADAGHSGGVWTLSPTTAITTIDSSIDLDATTQPGHVSAPIVVLDGSSAPASTDGLVIGPSGDGTTVRGFAIGAFSDDGIEISSSADGVTLAENYVGVEATGLGPLANGDDGVDANGGSLLTIGDSVISGNSGAGIMLQGTGATIVGNMVGVGSDGITPLGNGAQGIRVGAGASSAVIGGIAGPDANMIASNGGAGISLDDTAGVGNSILGNSIHSNTTLGIDLGDDEVTPNDSGDGDAGPNGLLNFPVITSATETGGVVTVDFGLDVPDGSYRVEFFDNAAADGSGNGEGETFVDFVDVVVSSGVPTPASATIAGATDDVITATATSGTTAPFGSTSEFSAAYTVTADGGGTTGVFTVNSTDDDGDSNTGDGVCDTGQFNSASATECTLRAAIEQANALGAGEVEFDMPAGESGHSGGVWTIGPLSAYDDIAATLTIDGRTQPGWTDTPVVEINGAGAGATTDGFRVDADSVEIRGLAINRFLADGIEIANGAADTVIAQNHVGLDASGLVDRGNAGRGVDLGAGSGPTTVGGIDVADRNIVSGNGGDGIIIWDSNSNSILSNYIGTDITGNAAIGNGANGVALGGTSSGNLIGASGDTNVISGNANDGVGNDATGINNAVYFNYIGMGADATTPVPNGRYGVVIYDGANNTWVYGNLIAGNTSTGVVIDGNGNAATTANNIVGNYIGIDFTSSPQPNGGHGVHIFDGATANVIGGSPAAYHNVISGNGVDGIRIDGAATSGNRVENNYIGTNIAGDAAVANGNNGVFIVGAPGNTIGGAAPSLRNVISGNGNNGVLLDAATATGNTIEGNYIGVNAAGTAAIPNVDEGVDLSDAPGNTVGGTSANERNVISGNGDSGVLLIGSGTTGNTVSGNHIGTNAAGDAAVANGRAGVYIEQGAASNTIGGATAGHRNVISGNTEDGMYITSAGTDDNTVSSNYIGTTAAGDAAIPNGDRGVQIESGASGNFIGTTGQGNVISGNTGDGVIIADWLALGTTNNEVVDNRIGVAADDSTALGNGANGIHLDPVSNTLIEGNTIAHNGADGVVLEPTTLTGNAIIGNSIYSNGQLGIDLGNDGYTANDGGDGDSGPNDLLNFPVIDSAVIAPPWITVNYTIDAPAADYAIDFFSNPSGVDPTGYGEGQAFEYHDSITHPGGSASYVAVFSGFITDELTATLTEDLGGSYGSTSEFSAVAPVTAGTLLVNSTDDDSDASPGDGVCDTGSNNTAGDTECTLRAAIEEANAFGGGADIEFAIPDSETLYRDLGPGAAYWRIVPGTPLDAITGSGTTIDATTQTAYAIGQGHNVNDNGPEIELEGTNAGGSGIEIQASNTEIRGFVINRFVSGIAVTGGDGSTIAGNYLGPDISGSLGLSGNDDGIYVYGATNTVIGGITPADRNLISGNRLRGIFINDSTDGAPAISDGTRVIGNYVGTNAAGTATLPYSDVPASQQMGLAIWDGPDNVIGTAADGNLFSGNSWYGVYIWGPNATNNKIQGNIIGLDVSATAAVPNAWESATRSGVYLSNTTGNLIGGIGLSEGNIIASNDHFGVIIQGVLAIDNSILSNEIYGNVDLGIELELDGVTPNDAGDVDAGANDLLNHPVITSATETAGTVTLVGTWDVPAGWYRIETFTNTVADGSGYGEGESITGSSALYHDGTGSGPWGAAFSGSVGDVITATATECTDLNCDDFNSTSEFSAAVTVTVTDTTAPVITLVGANPQTIEFGSSYVELGATALDDVDGDISGSIVIDAAAVNTAALGSYTVTYDVSDAAGNSAAQLTRTVNVVDTTGPVLTLLGANPQSVEVGSAYVESGATASDTHDGDLTGSIVTNAAAVNTSAVGSYVVTYDVSDAAGNPSSGFRTVNVVDTTAPVITLVGANPQSIEAGNAYVELGATAADIGDGDVTGSIVIDTAAVDTGTVGSYSVTYNVSDSQGNAAVQVTRTVDVVDTGIPVITRVGVSPVTVEVGSVYVDAGATAFDVGDGDLTGSIVTVDPVDTLTFGSYVVTYNVSDSQGNSAVEVTRTVNVVDTTAPVITLTGVSPVTVEVGSAYVDAGATAFDVGDGDLSGSIVTVNPVDTAAVGSYTVTYNVSDSQGNAAVEVTRTVNVVDTTAPVITLVGANPQTIEVGSPYVELGASAADAFYGDISGSIVIDSSAVNTAIVGSYTVTYNVSDANGNPAVQVTRTVNVGDTSDPVITLVGVNPQVIEVGSAYSELGATAFDAGDGDLTGSIVIDTSAVNTAAVGSYTVTYNVTDSQANAAVEVARTVNVVDTTIPVITLVGANPQIVEVGSGYSELGATASDNYDGDISGSIVVDSSAVVTAAVGSYTVTYNVSDANGNAAVQVTRTVSVVDGTVPVITLVGANPQVIEVGSSYIELGATATDNYDGDITGSIVVDSSAVVTATVGSYMVTYNVSDASGNAAVQVTRTVSVVDGTVPVITLVGADPQVIEVGTPYSELGATAADNYDGDITGSIVINASAVDTNVVASYLVTYNVTDANGNAAVQVTRTVSVVDTAAPVITLVGANPQVIEVGSSYSELGATASDNYDGDISGSIVINASTVDTNVVASYLVTYNVSDANGNAAVQVTRTVNVVDTTIPVITLVGANPQVIEVGSSYSELGATATDNYDGDITGSIAVDSSAVVTAAVGSYTVTYNVTDANGNAAVQVTRTVNVVDTTVPVITLVGADPQVIEVGSVYSELGATALDSYDGDITGSIVIDATSVNTAFVGFYSVTYNVSDSGGNAAAEVARTVNVVDTTVPVITLVGANPQIIEAGSSYNELGATASDSYDGDITGSIVIDATAVNTSVVGSYPVTYNVDDAAGNPATQVTRTVSVVDTTAPVITLVGANPQTIEVLSAYTELGATAIDAYDGNLTGAIVIDATAVNTSLVGSYSVTYNVTDTSGNPAVQVTRTVNVVDTTAPVIALAGANPQSIEVASTYVELGATAIDNYDGNISGSIVVDSTAVDTSVVGSYPVTYNVTDSQGNPAVEAIRTVNVVDTAAPVITVVGANPLVLEVHSPYVEAGATAIDVGDGDVTGLIVIDSSAVDTAVVGSYPVTYNVTDSQGNPAVEATRTVSVVDTTIPVIALVGANPQVIEVGSAYAELGATANDNYDGDISSAVVVDAAAVNTAVVGSYPVTYNVTDANGNAAIQVTRTVNVVDTTLPVIALLGADPLVIEVGSAYVELGATAVDNYDGDISGAIVIDSAAVNTAVVGSYPVTYNVTDANGNAAIQVTRTVNVVDTTVPVITLLGANPQVIEVHSPYVEQGATAADNYDGDITGSIVINAGAVNTAVVGTYVVTYDVSDSSGNPAFAFRAVDVVDTTDPVITLAGANPQSLEVGSPYVELGATALDNYDGDISGAIVIDSSAINTAVLGSYPVTYNVTDANGNSAAQVTRTVTVADTTRPVITLIGANPQTVDVASLYVELGATASDNYDGDITGLIVIDSSAVNPTVVGSYSVTYNVIDANGNTALQVTRTVNVVNVAPALGAIADRAGPEGTMVTFTAVASDPDPTDILTYSLSGAPAGTTIDPSSGIFTWTPTEAQGPGVFTFDVVVSDAGTPALTDQQTLTITVSEVNTAPVLGVVGPQTVDEMTGLSFTAPVTDVDIPANPLTFSLAGAPVGATINPTTGAFSWTPTEAQGPGVYGFDIAVGDGGSPTLTDTRAVTVSVAEINVAPVVANPGPQSSAEADPVTLTVTAADVDIPTNTLSYSAVGLPAGLSINAATGEISGTITYDASPGSPYTTTVTATDNGVPARSHQATFNWVVADTNRDPIPADDNVSLPEDSTRLFTVLSNDLDPDMDPLSVDAVGAPTHGSTTISGPGITYTPDADYFGPDAFQYSVSDGRGGVVTAAVNVTVVPVNDPPVLNSPTFLAGNEGSPISFTASATDVEGDQVSFSLAAAPAGAAIDATTGYFSWIPAEAQGPGTYTFDVLATDDGTPALSTSRQLEITVAEVNSAPVIANPGSQFSAEDRAVSLQVVAIDSDVPAETLRYAASGLPPGLAIDPDTGEITGTSPFDAAASYSITITVTDDGVPQRSSQTTFTWTVTNTNRPPSADDLTVFAAAGVPTSLVLNGSDPDGDTLSFQIATDPAEGVLTGGPRLYDYTADVAANGTDTFTFIVSDGDMQAVGTATVSITPNLVPYGGSDEYVVRQGGVLVVDAPGVLGNDRDPEGKPISAVVDTAPAYGSLTLNADGSFVYDNRGASVDIDTFSYWVDDGMRLSEPISVLIVIEENLAPVVVDDSVAVDEDTAIVVHPLANDHDPNNEPLVLRAVGSPEHGSVEWSLDGSVIFTPERDWNGSDTMTYTATDGDLETSGSIAIVVRPVNDAPAVVAAEVTGHSGDQLVIDLRPFATDVDGDSLEFILESPTNGTVRRESAGVFVIDLDGVVHDLAPLTFVASDPSGAKASSLLTVIVRIPASLVGVPSLVADDLGDPSGTDGSPTDDGTDGGVPLLTGLRLMVGSMFDTFQALRVPMFAVLLLALASLYLGLSQKFAFVSTPTALPLIGRRKVDIVMAQSGAGVSARTEPGTHQSVKFRFAPTERGLITTGARTMVRSEVWVEVETPEGDGWVNAEFLTEQMTDAAFSEDERPTDLTAGLVDRIYRADDLLEATAGHDLHVAYYGPPIRFAANSLPRLLRGASVYWWWQADGDTPRLQGTFGETVGESITAAFRNRGAHLADSAYSIPPEFVNMHSLVLGHHEYGEGWRVFLRYENDEPSIAGLMREAQPNKAAMLGEMRQKTA